jgi:hypothetical protein
VATERHYDCAALVSPPMPPGGTNGPSVPPRWGRFFGLFKLTYRSAPGCSRMKRDPDGSIAIQHCATAIPPRAVLGDAAAALQKGVIGGADIGELADVDILRQHQLQQLARGGLRRRERAVFAEFHRAGGLNRTFLGARWRSISRCAIFDRRGSVQGFGRPGVAIQIDRPFPLTLDVLNRGKGLASVLHSAPARLAIGNGARHRRIRPGICQPENVGALPAAVMPALAAGNASGIRNMPPQELSGVRPVQDSKTKKKLQ